MIFLYMSLLPRSSFITIFFKNKPKYPPSKSQLLKNKEVKTEEMNLKGNLLGLIKNKNYILLFISASFSIGYYNLYGTVLANFLEKFLEIFRQFVRQIVKCQFVMSLYFIIFAGLIPLFFGA